MKLKSFFFLPLIGLLLTACNPSAATPIPQVGFPSPTEPSQTSPGPATATQTFTPIPTFTSTPYPMYYTEEFNSDFNGWTSFQTGGSGVPNVRTENSLLRVDITSPDTWYYAIQNAHEYSNVTIRAQVEWNPGGSMGLVCYYNESQGWYEFNIASDRSYNILFGQWLAKDIARYTPIATETTDYLETGNLKDEIGLTCQGNNLLLYINGKLFRKLDVSHYGLTEGRIGITASSFDQLPMTAFWDWVAVSE